MGSFEFPFTMDDVVVNLLGLRTNKGFPPANTESYRVLCPFCKKEHYTLDVQRNKYIWSCQACGNTGGVLDLYRKVKYGEYTTMTNKEALKEIMEYLHSESYAPVYQRVNVKTIKENKTCSPKDVHRVYARMFKMPYFKLRKEHEEDLLKRGLPKSRIIENGYRSSPCEKYAYAIASELIAEGLNVSGIPGFYLDDGSLYAKLKEKYPNDEIKGYKPGCKNWAFKCRPEGFYIPIRNSKGLIVSIQIRTKNPDAKYVFMSSANLENGCKAVSAAHYSGRFSDMPDTVYLTEGPLKGDIATALTGRMFVAIPGISTYKAMSQAFSVLKTLGVKEVVEAFDMDRYTNENVRKSVKKIRQMAKEAGFIYTVFAWEKEYKGIDDYLVSRNYHRYDF